MLHKEFWEIKKKAAISLVIATLHVAVRKLCTTIAHPQRLLSLSQGCQNEGQETLKGDQYLKDWMMLL